MFHKSVSETGRKERATLAKALTGALNALLSKIYTKRKLMLYCPGAYPDLSEIAVGQTLVSGI